LVVDAGDALCLRNLVRMDFVHNRQGFGGAVEPNQLINHRHY
jgi:hypothetical protein